MKYGTFAWHIVDHTQILEHSMVGYHCPTCGKFYAQGRYTIEGYELKTNELYILGTNIPSECCGEKLFTPLIFINPREAERFLFSIVEHWREVTPIKSSLLITAHFRNDLSTYH